MMISKCEKCSYKKACINGANYQNAKKCKKYTLEDDVQEVKHGEWLEISEYIISIDGTPVKWTFFYCSECEAPVDSPTNYCPNCGAKMEVQNNDS